MAERHGVEFQIEPSDTRGAALLDDAALVAVAWLRDGTGFPADGAEQGDWEYDDGRIEIRRERHGELSTFELVWLYRSGASEWTIEVRLSTSGDSVAVEGSLRTTATDGAEQRGIGVTAQLIEQYHCRRDGNRLRTAPHAITPHELEPFAQDLLLRADRELPIVAVSELDAGRTLIDSNDLQRRLAGAAHVVRLEARSARSLVDLIGRSRSCYNGAVRLYLPGFTTRDPSSQHPFWLAGELRRPGGRVRATIIAQTRRAAARAMPGTAFAAVQSEIRSHELERLRDAVTLQPEDQRELVKSLQRRVAHEQRWREDALRELARIKSEYEQAQHELDRLRTEDEQAQQARELLIDTVPDAVQRADAQSGRHLSLLPSAFASADQSRFLQPMLVFDALMRLNRLGDQLHSGEIQPAQIVQTLNDDNLECSTESVDTMNRYGDQRRFRDETGQLIEMPLHIKLGGGHGQDNFLRVHFAWIEDYGEILVGYVGRHLRTQRS